MFMTTMIINKSDLPLLNIEIKSDVYPKINKSLNNKFGFNDITQKNKLPNGDELFKIAAR